MQRHFFLTVICQFKKLIGRVHLNFSCCSRDLGPITCSTYVVLFSRPWMLSSWPPIDPSIYVPTGFISDRPILYDPIAIATKSSSSDSVTIASFYPTLHHSKFRQSITASSSIAPSPNLYLAFKQTLLANDPIKSTVPQHSLIHHPNKRSDPIKLHRQLWRRNRRMHQSPQNEACGKDW